ncbi:MAG: hypothetical protein JWL77_2633 [Chthonomonadaceae bacterium]|nr:hypothetical protein [Chthonomonadaceae bacterium]
MEGTNTQAPLKLCIAFLFAWICLGGLPHTANAGTWTITSVFSGTATGTFGNYGSNGINGTSIANGATYTFLATASGINGLVSSITRAPTTAQASTSGCKMTFTFTWVPAAGKDLTTDPPPPMFTAVITLHHTQNVGGHTEGTGGTITGIASVSGDGVTIPTLQNTKTGANLSFTLTTGWQDTKVIHMLAPNASGVATLDVSVAAQTSWTYSGGQLLQLPPSGSAGASILPLASVKDAVLTTPDPTVFPETFPTMSTDGRNRYYFDGSMQGVLSNPSWVASFIGVSDPTPYLPNTIFTSFTIPGSTRTDGMLAVSGTTIQQLFTYTGLPVNNSDFNGGNRYQPVNLTVTSADINTNQTAHVQIFFTKGATNHPASNLPVRTGAGPIPNWYYYWLQAPNVNYGTPYWGGVNGGSTGITTFDATQQKWISVIYDQAGYATGAGTWNNAEGIDLFANILRHEEQHREDLTTFWGNSLVDPGRDLDNDYMPDDLEPYLVGGHPYDPNNPATFADTFNYGVNPLPDMEDYALRREAAWVNGSADLQDWAYPGHQWH